MKLYMYKDYNYTIYFEDILASIEKINRYVDNYSFNDLIEDDMRVDAVIRNLEIIGEAAGEIPQEIRDKYPNIEWRKIIGL